MVIRPIETYVVVSLGAIAILAVLLIRSCSDEPPEGLTGIPGPVTASPGVVTSSPASCSSDFLGADDFSGDWLPEPPSDYIFGGSSEFSGKIFAANIDRKLVENVLPVNWTLAPQALSSQLCHPVLILFGRHENAGAIIFGVSHDVGGSDDAYQEMMLLIPFVQRDLGGPLWHTAVIRMYLDDSVATAIGNKYYSYAKEMATLTQTSSSIDVLVSGLLAFQATTSSPGPWQSVSTSTIENLGEIQDILRMPLVGVEKNPAAVGGEFDRCSYFNLTYSIGGVESRVRSLSIQHDYYLPFVPAMASWVSLPALGNATGGALEIQGLSWRLKFPANAYCQYSK